MEEVAPERKDVDESSSLGSLVESSMGEVKVLTSMDYRQDPSGFKWTNVVLASGGSGSSGMFSPGEGEFSGSGTRARLDSYDDITSFLNVNVYKYIDPATQEKYFKIANERINETVPQERLFD